MFVWACAQPILTAWAKGDSDSVGNLVDASLQPPSAVAIENYFLAVHGLHRLQQQQRWSVSLLPFQMQLTTHGGKHGEAGCIHSRTHHVHNVQDGGSLMWEMKAPLHM
jgi:hypothetical protein